MKIDTTLVKGLVKRWSTWRTAILVAGTIAFCGTTKAQVVFNESFAGGASTAGFTITQSLGTCGWTYSNPGGQIITGAGFDANFAIFDSDHCGSGPGESTGELLSPVFDASASNNFILTFDQAYRYCCSSVAAVAVWDGTTWNNVYTLPTSSSVGFPGPAVSESFSITAAANGYTAAQIRFQYDGDWAYWWALDNIVLTGVDCLAPSDLAVTGITPVGGTISWTDNGSVGYSWAVTTGDVPDGTNEVAEGDGSITTITGLNSNTSYTAWVRADCGDGSFSDWSSGVAFSTPPTCVQPTNPVVSNLTISSADLAWTASVSTPANGYQWEVRTANGPGTGSNGLATSGTTAAGITSAATSTLSANTHYSLYVRADCGSGDFSSWTSGTTFNTLCNASDIPYYEDFSSVTVPAIPNCMSIQTVAGNPWTTSTSVLPGMTDPTARVSYTFSGPAMDSWLYTAGLNLTGGVSYQLMYKYGNNLLSYTEAMSVSYGTGASEAAMVNLLVDHTAINDAILHIDTLNFTPATSGVYYIGFKCHSITNQYYLLLDDISVMLTPSCYSPVATSYVAPDCANGQYFVHVDLTSLGDATSVDIMSDYTGNPGGQTGITATGDYTVGPFPNLSTVNISVVHTTDDSCTIALDPITYDCSDFGKNALSFDGVDDRVNCGNNPSVAITGNSVTLEAWIYPTAWKTNTYQANIINSEGGNTGYMLRCGAGGELDFNLGDGAGFHQLISPANTLTLNTWQYVAGTYDGDSMRMYVNGVQIMALYGVFNIGATGTGLAVGDWSNGTGRNFPGKIDEVRVWNTAVSGANILAHMNTAYCGNETGLVAYYKFDQGIANEANPTVTILNDGTAYGNNGTLTGFTLDGASSNWVVGVTNMGDCVPVACVAPLAVTITNPTDNGFDISWTDVGAASYEYEVRSSGAAGSGATGLEANGSPVSGSPAITISGLTANADYSVYARSACDGGLFSDWTPAVNFHLGYCIPTDTSTIWYIDSFVTTGGSTNINNTGSGLSAGGYGDFSALNVSTYAGEPFNFSAAYVGNTFHTRIWVDWNNDFNFDATELVYDGTVYVDTATGMITVPAGTPEGNYRMRIRQGEVGTPTPCGSSALGEAEDYTITVTAPPSCLHPTAIVTSALTATTVDFSWTAPTPEPAEGYQWEVRSSGDAGSGSVGLQSTGTTAAGVTNAGATGLISDTDYFIYVRSICGGGDTSSWHGPTDIHTGYCVSTSVGTSAYFTNFTTTGGVVNINNTSDIASNGYSNFTSDTVSQASTLSVTFATTMSGGNAGTGVWVDWNGDMDFDDAGEQVYMTTNFQYGVTGLITVPGGTPEGNYRMRIRCDYYNSTVDPCGAMTTAGETEDYTFRVLPAPSCISPLNVMITALTFTSADFSWDPSSSAPADGYQWEVRTSGDPGSGATGLVDNGSTAAGVTNDVTSALVIDTDYMIYVRSVCGAGDTSAWSFPESVHTGYCASNFTSVQFEHITNVNYAGIDNTTAGVAGGPVDYTDQVATVEQGDTHTLSVTILAELVEYVYVFIDWNQNGILDDSGEVYTVASDVIDVGPFTLDIVTPADAVPGNTRMRVMLAYNNPLPDPCVSQYYGEAEDYTVHVTVPPVDCEGMVNGPAMPGTDCTTSDGLSGVWSDACVCEAFDCENVAGGPALPGTACIASTGNGGMWSSTCICVENVGVDEIAGTAGFAIYPNPASTTLYISTTNKTPVHIKVYDMMGTLVMEKDMAEQLDITKLASGSYTLVATDAKGENERHARFMKQ